MRRTEEVMMDVMGIKPLGNLHRSASLEWQQCEKTLFHIPRSIPPHGQRILAVMENGALKIEILAYLPQICERMLNGDSILEEIVGSTCLQELTRLLMVHMAWKDSNSGQIPSDETNRAALMEKCLSDKKTSPQSHEIMRGRLMLKRRKTATCDEGGRSEQDKAFEPQMDKTKYGLGLQLPNNNSATATTTTVHSTSYLTKTTVSVPMNIQQDDRKSPYKNEPQAEQVLEQKKTKEKKNKMITSLLKRDPSKFYFLWDLIMPGAEAGGTSEQEQTKRSSSLQATKESTPEKCKVNMLQLIRQALESKYEDHVHKALREKDLKSLLCILTLLTDHEIPTVTNAWRHSLPTSSHYPASYHRPRTNHSAQIPDRSEKKKKKKQHKAGCRRQPLLHPSNDYYPSRIDEGNDRLEKECELHSYSNQPSSVMSSSDSSRPTYHSTESDSDFHSEIWAILQRAEEQDQEPLVQILPFFQEDTLDSINLPSHYTVDEVETELNVQENATNESLEELIAPDGNIPEGQQTMSDSSKTESVSSGPEMMVMERFSDPPLPPTRSQMPTLDLTLIHGRVLSPHQELTEESESKTEGLAHTRPPKAEQLEPYRENVERDEIKETEKKSIGETYWDAELRKSYTTVLNLLSNNPKIHMWIECNLIHDDKKGSTDALQSIQFLFQCLQKLMEDRVGSTMEETVRREKELRDMWASERRLASQLRGLQAEMKALEHQHVPYMLTLDFQIRILNSRLRKISKEIFQQLRDVVQETELNAGIKDKAELINLSKAEEDVEQSEDHRLQFKIHHSKEYDKFKTKMTQMNRLLDNTIAHYDQLMSKMQRKLDDTVAETAVNEKKVKAVQTKFADVSSRYIDMCAEKKLKQIMKNMEMKDERKRNRAAQTIQECWRRYKIRKRKRERRKARKAKRKGGAHSFAAPKKKT